MENKLIVVVRSSNRWLIHTAMSLSSKDKARLYHDLGTMLQSGFHLDRGVELLLSQNPSRGARQWLEGLQLGLQEQLSVAEAVRQHSQETSELETGLIEAGERGGRLDEACQHLAEYFELRQRSVSKAMGALVYPIILAHLGALFPDISKMMLGGGVGAGFAGVPMRLAILWIILSTVMLSALTLSRLAGTSQLADRILGLVPLVGSIRRHWALARFSQVMRTGLLASLKISEALRLAGAATQSAVMKAGAESAAQSVEEGCALSDSLRSTHAFPVQFNNSIEMAEHSGTLDVEMDRWAIAESQLAAVAQDRAAEWLPRIFYLLVVLYVASRVVSMFMGYYGKLGEAMGDLDKVMNP